MLLSIVIPTYDRTHLLITRALPSILHQETELDLEIIVVGDGEQPATKYALDAIGDDRVFYENRPRPEYPEEETIRWGTIGLEARNWGHDHAQGDFLMALDDDDAMADQAIAMLHQLLVKEGADLVYGKSVAYNELDQVIAFYGFWPPIHFAFCEGAWFSKHDLGYRFDPKAPLRGLPGDGDRIDRMVAGGVKFAFLDEVVHYYWPNRHPKVSVGH